MQIIETFGHYVENLTNTKPESARWLLKTGWEAQNLKFHYMQDKRLMPANRHLCKRKREGVHRLDGGGSRRRNGPREVARGKDWRPWRDSNSLPAA